MATKDALIAEEGTHISGDTATFDKNAERVNFELEPKSIGLTKEQLEKYRNDPFWKPVRTILFALFWLAWIAMFGGAIAIVLMSPKCAEKQKPEWWQQKVSYQILTATFRDTDGDGVGDFAGITEKLDLLRKAGVTTIYPTPVIEISSGDYYNAHDVVDHMKVDKRFGREEQFKELIDTVHKRDMYIVMDLPVSSVSIQHPWFLDNDKDKFILAKPTDAGFNKTNFFPFHGSSTLKYLGFPTSENPVLNWKNEQVKETIKGTIKKFLLLGVDGFHIDHVSQLAVDAVGKTNHDDAIATLKEITGFIKTFAASQDELVEKKIALFSSIKDIEELHSSARETGDLHYVIDNTFANMNKEKCGASIGQCVHNALDAAYKRHEKDDFTPYWQFSNADSSRLSSRFETADAHLLTFLQLTLPGAVSLYYGQEYGLKDGLTKTGTDNHRGVMQFTPTGDDHHGFSNDQHEIFFGETKNNYENDNYETQYYNDKSPLKVHRKLALLRGRDESLVVGETVRDEIVNDVILFSRFVRHNDTVSGFAFVSVLNFGIVDQKIDFKTEPYNKVIPAGKEISAAQIAIVSANVTTYAPHDKINLAENTLDIPAKSAILFKL